ncbi:MAG: Tetratricopeptide repeat protein [Deltaproteobacteria bacterium]|nr:Tetratricopeptide repeat protein [Deltaproteobacteria bacterium]
MSRGWLAVVAVLLGIHFSFAADISPQLQNDRRWEEARKYLADGKPGEAKALFEDLLKQYPTEADVHLFLGITQLRLRNPEGAASAIKRALDENPSHADARTLLGWIELEVRGDIDAAIKEYQKVIELRPELAEAYSNLAAAQRKKGEFDRALENLNEALKRKPDFAAALTTRGGIFAEQNKWAEARRDFEQALKINPADDGALYGLAQVLGEARDYAGAQKALRELIARSPNFVYWLEWGRIGLIRYWLVWLSVAIGFFLKGRFMQKARTEAHG